MSFSDFDVTFSTDDSSVPVVPPSATTQASVVDPGMSFLLSFDNTPAAQSFLSLLQIIVSESVRVAQDSESSAIVAPPPLSFPQMHSFSQNVHGYSAAFDGLVHGLSVSSTVASAISRELEKKNAPILLDDYDTDTDDSFTPLHGSVDLDLESSSSSCSVVDNNDNDDSASPCCVGFVPSHQDPLPFDDFAYDPSMETSTIPSLWIKQPLPASVPPSSPPLQMITPFEFWNTGLPKGSVPEVAASVVFAAPLPFVPVSSLPPRSSPKKTTRNFNPYSLKRSGIPSPSQVKK